ncbi:MAG: anaerobic ribonucleoside-triphosphate reductase activating protein [Candidatus Aenigmatarchaeota archaeon]
MKIGGIQKTSLIDYPEKISTVVFTQGCNFRCRYCYNSKLVLPELFEDPIDEKDIFSFLEKRKGKIDGVVISGGEPTIHKDLPIFIKKIKDMGFLVKVDTNGTNAKMIESLINEKLVDYVAMDVKAPLEKYENITQTHVDKDNIKKTIEILLNSKIEYEFRTTYVKSLLTLDDFIKIGEMIKNAKLYAVQAFLPTKTLIDKNLEKEERPEFEELETIANTLRKYVKKCIVRV